MKNCKFRKASGFMTITIAALVLGLFTGQSLAQYKYIDIVNPFLRKIPMAIPEFKSITGTEPEMTVARQGADMLSDMLAFTGYFSMLDRGAFLSDPQKSGIETLEIKFTNWTAIGAELLIRGGVLITDDVLQLELRLFDTIQQQMLVGKRYRGSVKDLRTMIRRFASDVIFRLTGHRGIFDSKIAFVSKSGQNKEIYLCDFDGKNVEQFTHHASITLFPAWSWDGNWIAYTSYARGKPDLYIKHVDKKLGSVVDKNGINSFASWVPGKFELAATLSFSGDQEIYLLTGEGKIIKQLTMNEGIDVSPTWSPDGKQMAFVSKRAGTPQIYIQNIETGAVNRLTYEGNYNTQPAWSPTGDKIAYSGMHSGGIDIFVIGVDGAGPVQLTHGTRDNESPTWSPDGSLIAFGSTRQGPSRIFVMTAYGTDQRPLLTMTGEQSNPKWSNSVGNNSE